MKKLQKSVKPLRFCVATIVASSETPVGLRDVLERSVVGIMSGGTGGTCRTRRTKDKVVLSEAVWHVPSGVEQIKKARAATTHTLRSEYGIEVVLTKSGRSWSGTIRSDLKAGTSDVNYCAAVDGLEALVLAHAVAGINIGSRAYRAGVIAAAEAIDNNT